MTSIMDGIRAKRDQIKERQVKRLPVPRWTDPDLEFRIRPVASEDLDRIVKGINETRSDAAPAGHAAVVALAIGTGKGVLFSGRPPMTIKELSVELGLPEEATAGDVIREVVITDGDLRAIFEAVTRFSGYETGIDLLDEELAGE